MTEETTGVDLVVEQLRVADGLPLSITATPAPRGHAMEFRINAEDPGRGYLPTPGRITRFDAPSGPGVRLDSGVACGSLVPGSFDALLAKLIVSGSTRAQVLARARRALEEFAIEGVASVLRGSCCLLAVWPRTPLPFSRHVGSRAMWRHRSQPRWCAGTMRQALPCRRARCWRRWRR